MMMLQTSSELRRAKEQSKKAVTHFSLKIQESINRKIDAVRTKLSDEIRQKNEDSTPWYAPLLGMQLPDASKFVRLRGGKARFATGVFNANTAKRLHNLTHN